MDTSTRKGWVDIAFAGTDTTLNALRQGKETLWLNPSRRPFDEIKQELALGFDDIEEAAARLQRFAPYFVAAFPETATLEGILESPLIRADSAARRVAQWLDTAPPEHLLIKCDSHLPISGSIKARGGIYEVLLHAEKLAVTHGLLTPGDDYTCFASEAFRTLFSQHSIVVGSTGNLGLSIGIISARLGFNVTVHMSADARTWKKALLREKGVQVVEHQSDYSVAVAQGREEALRTPRCHFVDDEDSTSLFLGYAVAALRLKKQLHSQSIRVDNEHPLIVHLPCGVGGGPGGIAFGLKHVFGDSVHCLFAEPTHSPCMLLGMHTQLHNAISVQDIGLDNLTCADGLAVGRASAFVGKVMEPLLDGIYTVSDEHLYALVALIKESEGLDLEPSAVAGLPGFARLSHASTQERASLGLKEVLSNATHLVWATGGAMVPDEEHAAYYRQGKALL
ncbi:D-serine ammonia-lyase [Vreelandella songnenensis]|uniref:Probable D-serine dehydratase n=1 Tax=Vreelandella songnenensis TaxID=1176243 RepID=A0A2T0UY11_9GAMM|nr:D-serine ammonia-lyase [Halomonas songnenensis]PRY62774.1 D-serine ammonia-lyase [Halomonas songnenensis]